MEQIAASLERRARECISRNPAWANKNPAFELAAHPVASPLHRAVANDCMLICPKGEEKLFVKLPHADMQADILPSAAAAARLAAQAGAAPALLLEQPGALGFAFLPPPWRYARTGDLQDMAVMASVLEAKRQLHSGDLLGLPFCPFNKIEALTMEAAAANVIMPEDSANLLRAASLIRDAIQASGIDFAFCHNDAAASNVMLNDGQVMLVDFDIAADNDPWYDIGAFINEVCDFDPARREAVEIYAGHYEEALFNRCRLYGVMDDLMWGMWGITRAVTSQRRDIEFWKYGTWRLLHARTAIASRDFELWLRRL